MCVHDGLDEECGPGCTCQCDNCMLVDDDPIYLSALYADEMENPL